MSAESYAGKVEDKCLVIEGKGQDMDRKSMKVKAKSAFKKHYWMIVVICLFASVFGVDYTSSTWSLDLAAPTDTVQTSQGTARSSGLTDILGELVVGNEMTARKQAKHNEEQIVRNDTNAVFGRKRGVLATLINSFSSGSVIISIFDAVNTVVHNGGAAVVVPVVLAMIV